MVASAILSLFDLNRYNIIRRCNVSCMLWIYHHILFMHISNEYQGYLLHFHCAPYSKHNGSCCNIMVYKWMLTWSMRRHFLCWGWWAAHRVVFHRRFGLPGVIKAVPLKIATWTSSGFVTASYRAVW
jgi:hypothetical protein